MMNTEGKTGVIIGATWSGLVVAKTIAGLFENLIIVERGDDPSLSDAVRQQVRKLTSSVQIMFHTKTRGLVCNAQGNMTGVMIQPGDGKLQMLRADFVIDTDDTQSHSDLYLQCLGYEAVACRDRVIYIDTPYPHMTTVRVRDYHKLAELPRGLFFVGSAISNIASLTGQEEHLAMVQASILRKYLVNNQGNLKFQNNLAYVMSLIVQEYIRRAKQDDGVARHPVTRRDPAMISR